MKHRIIGISGVIGAGKDTVGLLLQYLLAKPDISDEELIKVLENYDLHKHTLYYDKPDGSIQPIRNVAFGTFLKTIGATISKESNVNTFTDRELKEKPFLTGPYQGLGRRDFLKGVADALRNFDNAIFVKDLMYEIDLQPYAKYIITDVRYDIEVDAIHKRDGIVLYVEDPHTTIKPHPGEDPLSLNYDHVVINDKTLGLPHLIQTLKIFIHENCSDR